MSPETAWLPVRMSPEVMSQMVEASAARGNSVEWGEPDADGFYTPTVTVATDTLDAAWRAVEDAAPREAMIRAGRTGITETGWATAYLHGNHLATAFSEDGIIGALRDLERQLR